MDGTVTNSCSLTGKIKGLLSLYLAQSKSRIEVGITKYMQIRVKSVCLLYQWVPVVPVWLQPQPKLRVNCSSTGISLQVTIIKLVRVKKLEGAQHWTLMDNQFWLLVRLASFKLEFLRILKLYQPTLQPALPKSTLLIFVIELFQLIFFILLSFTTLTFFLSFFSPYLLN